MNRSADGETPWMGVNHPTERESPPLTRACLGKQIIVLAGLHAAQCGGAIQENRVGELRPAIELGCPNIHPAQEQTTCDRRRNVHIHGSRHRHDPSLSQPHVSGNAVWA